jgi:pyrimidine deaminase RibD-like protein
MQAGFLRRALFIRKSPSYLFAAMLILLPAPVLSTAYAAAIKTPHAEVELLAADNALVAGKDARIALSIKHAPH